MTIREALRTSTIGGQHGSVHPPRRVRLLAPRTPRRAGTRRRRRERRLRRSGRRPTLHRTGLRAFRRRGETEIFARPGHIPGSINLPVDRVRNPATGALRPVGELHTLFTAAGLLDPAIIPVAYCAGGVAATSVAHALASVGREDAAVYDGSLSAWTADPALPLTPGEHDA
ncbi:sulfurtransferase [Nocardia neocaledoniensis]|uniref:sulfurtransferase n=1 Tax=Nocardia neocaledoniensis TaxID=236511 RepID=UPI000D715254|nr:rhodanese-like domain-containing protein [Nocardia neocaledoniensis]